MRSESRRLFIPAVIGALVVAFLLQGSRAQSAPSGDKVLLLGISQGGRLQERATAALAARLQEREVLLSADSLLPSERHCQRGPCLERLAAKMDAHFIIWGTLEGGAGRAPLSVMLHLFDARKGAMDYLPALVQQNESLEDAIKQLGGSLLQHYRAPIVLAERPARRSPVDDLVGSMRRPERSSTAWRVGVASGLGVLAALSAAGVIVLSTLQGTPRDGVCQYNGHNDSCVWESTGLMATGYTVSAVCAIGMGLTIGLR
jgi:hypothetical protein